METILTDYNGILGPVLKLNHKDSQNKDEMVMRLF